MAREPKAAAASASSASSSASNSANSGASGSGSDDKKAAAAVVETLITRVSAAITASVAAPATTAAAGTASASAAALAASVGAVGASVAAPAKRLPLVAMYHLDTNAGDATIVVGESGCVVIDCGFTWNGNRLCAIGKKLCSAAPKMVCISHFDKDHFYGLGAVLAGWRPALLVTPAKPAHIDAASHISSCEHRDKSVDCPDGDLEKMCRVLKERNLEVGRSCSSKRCRDPIDPAPVTIQSAAQCGAVKLGPAVTMSAVYNAVGRDIAAVRKKNNSSIAWGITAGQVNYFTAGDLEEDEEHVPTAKYHIIKCGHHGSKNATKPEFLARMKPVVAVLQGAQATHGHPTAEVLTRLRKAQVNSFATGLFVQYRDVPAAALPTVAGGPARAGDIVTVAWDDGVFSVHYVNHKGAHQRAAYASNGAAVQLRANEITALEQHLLLPQWTDLASGMNAGLKKAKTQHKVKPAKPNTDASAATGADGKSGASTAASVVTTAARATASASAMALVDADDDDDPRDRKTAVAAVVSASSAAGGDDDDDDGSGDDDDDGSGDDDDDGSGGDDDDDEDDDGSGDDDPNDADAAPAMKGICSPCFNDGTGVTRARNRCCGCHCYACDRHFIQEFRVCADCYGE